MITYECLIARLFSLQDTTYREFHQKLLNNERIHVIGVRLPILRGIAKEWKNDCDALLRFPDEYYEVTMLKCLAVAMLPYEKYCKYVDRIVVLLDNWATCDSFRAPCIKKHKKEFFSYVERYLQSEREFVVRFGLVSLLHDYVDKEHYAFIFSAVERCDCSKYYIHMAVAWLISEVLVKEFEVGTEFLATTTLPKRTKNKAIQKARESFRLTTEQKQTLFTYRA